MTRDLAAVIAGGAVGTTLRVGLDALIPHGDDTFPVSTLVVNVVGAFALGLVVARLRSSAPSWLLAGLGPGLLGSFTTFSAFVIPLVTLASSDRWMTAVGYLAGTLLLGLGAAAAGLALGRGLGRGRRRGRGRGRAAVAPRAPVAPRDESDDIDDRPPPHNGRELHP